MRPTTILRRLAVVSTAAVLLAACGGDDGADDAGSATEGVEESAADDGATDEMTDESSEHMSDEDMSDEDMTDGDEAMTDGDDGEVGAAPGGCGVLAAVSATAPDGTTFTLGDLEGQPVLVETFATWCTTCRQQLGDTQQAAVEAGEDAVFLALSVEQDLDPAALAAYAEDNGFTDIRFGVLDDASLLALRDQYGGAVLVPPSTPKFRVAPDGQASELTTGFESAEEILASLGA